MFNFGKYPDRQRVVKVWTNRTIPIALIGFVKKKSSRRINDKCHSLSVRASFLLKCPFQFKLIVLLIVVFGSEFGDSGFGLVTVVTIAATFVASQSEDGFIIGKGVVETVGIWLVRLVNVNSVNCGGDLGGKTSFDLWLIIIF